MRIDLAVLAAYAIAGAIWVSGLSVITLMSSVVLIIVGVAYALVFGVALAWERLPTVPTLVAAWASAVAMASVLMAVMDQEVGAVVLAGGVLGTFLFGAWAVPGFFILLVLDPDLRKHP